MQSMRTTPGGLGLLAAFFVVAAGLACHGPTDPLTRGKERYGQCAPCHGANGQGKPELAAPPIAGLPEWYLSAQLGKFRMGARGDHVEDTAGLRMRSMSLTLPAEEDVTAVARYIASLPRPPKAAAALVDGDAAHGQAGFATCVACHGADGAGNPMLNAPPIAGQADWYLQTQLKNFKRGVRGKSPNDKTGPTMQAIAASLDDQQIKDLAAWVASMPSH